METQAQAIVVTHEIGSPTVVIDPETVAECLALAERASAIETVDADNLDEASEIVRKVQRTLKAIETSRTEVKKPALAFGRQIDAAAKEVSGPLAKAKDGLGRLIAAHQQRAEQERREAQRLADEQRRKAVEEAERKAKSERDRAAFLGESAPAQLPKVEIAAPVVVPEKVSGTGVSTRQVARLEIDDMESIPIVFAGAQLWTLNERVVLGLLRSGAKIPGCHIEWDETTVVRG